MKNFSIVLIVILFSNIIVLSQSIIFSENFDSLTVGSKIACENPSLWTTWSNAPCGNEDAVVSNNYFYSNSNSLLLSPGNDLVKDFGEAFTSGKYKISFKGYIPQGKDGYFNTLATFAGVNSNWGMECYFTTTGICSVFAGSTTPDDSTTYPVATWFPIEVIVDLGSDLAQLYVNDTLITVWQWTLGSNGSGVPLMLDANDFYGQDNLTEFYIDDYQIINLTPNSINSEHDIPSKFFLDQNYPNPFNPGTKISWQSPVSSWQTLKVYDILGNEVANLIDEFKPAGSYEVDFDAFNLSSGIYFYQLNSGDFKQTKKMILIK